MIAEKHMLHNSNQTKPKRLQGQQLGLRQAAKCACMCIAEDCWGVGVLHSNLIICDCPLVSQAGRECQVFAAGGLFQLGWNSSL